MILERGWDFTIYGILAGSESYTYKSLPKVVISYSYTVIPVIPCSSAWTLEPKDCKLETQTCCNAWHEGEPLQAAEINEPSR